LAVRAPAAEVLRDATRNQHQGESFEKALSRAVRKAHGTFQDYVELIGKVRERAKKDRTQLDVAAKALATEL